MIVGETVEFARTGAVVENVLIAPGTALDRQAADELAALGATSAFTLHFPREFEGDLEGERLVVRGEVYRVLGCPKPYTLANNITPWNMPVEVAALHYDVPFSLEACVPTLNNKGDSVNEWEEFYSGWCRVKQISSEETQIAGKTESSIIYTIYCDYDDSFIDATTKNTRLVVNSLTFDITEINNHYLLGDVVSIKAVCNV